ncbi:hypothetical protein BTK96_000401 [Burkholderia pyrrocinia]|uniref:hypothetical protein n=1 Tax=Burkholderia sp. IT-111MI5 TaxID=3026439 RepID=UPI002A2AC732|nr:hypothetical protein [Burkholderia pyrrocinia]EKS9893202.1 hypothetical protein [Burkholderia pyrrocinia]
MREYKFCLIGFFLIVVFFALSEFFNSLGGYQFKRIGLSSDCVLVLLWGIPCVATFLVSRYSSGWIGFVGFVYLILIPVLAVIIQVTKEALGFSIDFPGVRGASIVFGIYFVLSVVPVSIGFILGRYLN